MPISVIRKRHADRGFTLIEVLITLIVFAIGILTVAGLQIVSKKTNYDAVQRTTASMLAQDIIQRMRANGDTSWGSYITEDLGGSSLGVPASNCSTAGVTCSPAQMATYDLYSWEQAIDGASDGNTGGLVDPSACIRGPAGGGEGSYIIILAWRGVNELSNPTIDAGTGGIATGCGAGDGNYGTNDANRRVLMVSTYLSPYVR